MLYLLLKELKTEDIEVGDAYLVGEAGRFNSLQLARVTSVEKWGFTYGSSHYWSNERFEEPPKGILIKKRQGHLELLMNEELLRQLSNSP